MNTLKTALKYTTLGVIIIVLAFLSLGLIHPSFNYSNTIKVDSSVEDAFTAFTDKERSGEWLIGYKGYNILEGEPHKPGSKFLMKFEIEGNKMEFTETITAFKQNQEISFDMETKYFNGAVQVKFSGSYPCTIEVNTVNSGINVFYCSMFYLMQGALKEQSQKNYNLLKEMIEQ